MKMLSLMAIALTMALTLVSADADAARRFGGGKSSGMQRQATTPPAAAPASAPSSPASAAAASKAPATAGAAPAAQPKRSWMGPLAGLAAGLGLAALASHFGFGEQMASMMMMGLLVMAVIAAIGFFMRRRAMAQQPAMGGAGGLQYATAGAERVNEPAKVHDFPMAGTSSGASNVVAAAPVAAANIPADFDVAGFVRNAKVHFIRLQAANDAGNLEDIREFTTPEMFAEAKMTLAERGAGGQETDVVNINAEVIDVAEEATRYVVSVRFTGLLREEKNGPVEPIDEVWHLVKPREGKGGWLLAGIQQTQ